MTSSSRQEGAEFHSRGHYLSCFRGNPLSQRNQDNHIHYPFFFDGFQDVHSLPSLLPPFSAPTPPLHCANRGERGLLVSSQRISCLQYQFHPFHSSFLCICGSRSQHQQSHDFLRKRKCILHLHHHCPTKKPFCQNPSFHRWRKL